MESVPGCSGSAPSGADICTSPDWIDFVNGNARRLSESEPEASAQGERRTQQGGPIIVQTGRTYNVWLTAPEGGPEVTFKGFLFRLSGNERQDVSGALGLSPISFDYSEILASDGERAAEPGVAPASCAPGVSGAGHTDAFGKTQVVVEMTIPPTATGSMSLEVSALLTDTVWFMTTFRFTAANENSMLLPEQPEIATFPPTAAPDPEAPVEKKQFAPLGECTGFRNGRPVCLQCQGDCDDDTECGQGLICHQRKGSEKVPHCRGDQRRRRGGLLLVQRGGREGGALVHRPGRRRGSPPRRLVSSSQLGIRVAGAPSVASVCRSLSLSLSCSVYTRTCMHPCLRNSSAPS